MKKNILILYTNYGTGHKTSAEAILEYVNTLYPEYNTLLLDPLSYARPKINKLYALTGRIISTHFRKFRERLYKKKMYQNYFKKSLFLNFCTTIFWSKKLEKKIKDFDPDIIISTQVGPTGLIAAHKDLFHAKLISVYTDYGVHRYFTVCHEFVDYYHVPNEEIKKEMIDLGIDEKKILVTGIPVKSKFLKKNIDKTNIKKKYDIKTTKDIYLFLCGGGLGYKNAFKYFEYLATHLDDVYVIFIAGKNKKLYQKALKYQKDNVLILGYIEEIEKLMSISSLILGKPGGLSTTEALTIGVPFCAIEPIPGQEINNVSFILNNDFGFYVEDFKNFPKFLKEIKKKDSLLKKKNSIDKNFKKYKFPDIENI